MKKTPTPFSALSLSMLFSSMLFTFSAISSPNNFEPPFPESGAELKVKSLINGPLSPTKSKRQFRTTVKGDIYESGGEEPENWFNLSPEIDGVEGVATESAYQTFGSPAQEIVVAVIDSGVDVNHEDLRGKVWINEDEIPSNGVDDDGNGYVDDVFGWNFIGNEKGMARVEPADNLNGLRLIKGDPSKQVDADTLEITRELVRLKKRKAELNAQGRYLPAAERLKLEELSKEIEFERFKANQNFEKFDKLKKVYAKAETVLKAAGLREIDEESLKSFDPANEEEKTAKKEMSVLLSEGYDKAYIDKGHAYFKAKAKYHYNTDSDTRAEIVKDNIDDKSERIYGNNDVIGPDSSHGTHVAGIIAAARDNGIGTNGVASNVKIMAVRTVPNGDERDKDVANAIYYAVDNGARVVNMSFGKSYSPYKEVVDKAVKYAEAKGVLLVHAAGNSAENIDVEPNFPNRRTASGDNASNWIEVGASSFEKGPFLAAGFSNFGQKSVDIFAPGKNIRAPFPNNDYQSISGTSMASPVVAGVAAALMGHYPDASAQTIRDAIIESARLYPGLSVYKRGIGKVLFEKLSSTGGVANLFNALELMQSAQLPFQMELAGN